MVVFVYIYIVHHDQSLWYGMKHLLSILFGLFLLLLALAGRFEERVRRALRDEAIAFFDEVVAEVGGVDCHDHSGSKTSHPLWGLERLLLSML